MTENNHEHLETLREIRDLMQKSSRFLSLSGLSGVWAGACALMGAAAIYWVSRTLPFQTEGIRWAQRQSRGLSYEEIELTTGLDTSRLPLGMNFWEFVCLDAIVVFVVALLGSIYFTTRRARRKGESIWNPTAIRVTLNMAIPLVVGGAWCLVLIINQKPALVAGATLVFYGLALVNASKYTLNDVRYLGFLETALGLLAGLFIGYGLEFWAIGFGVCHILYGIFMYYKYDRQGI